MLIDLDPKDLAWCVARLPGALRFALETHPGLFVVAGGFIRATIAGEDPKDIDVFAREGADASELARTLFGDRKLTTRNAHTGLLDGRLVQLIHAWTFETAADLLHHFDFTIARAVLWHDGKGWSGTCDSRFYRDLAARRLVYTDPPDKVPGGSLLRAFKFASRGYRIPLDSMATLVAAVATEFMPGVDADTLAESIRHRLVEIDPGFEPADVAARLGEVAP